MANAKINTCPHTVLILKTHLIGIAQTITNELVTVIIFVVLISLHMKWNAA